MLADAVGPGVAARLDGEDQFRRLVGPQADDARGMDGQHLEVFPPQRGCDACGDGAPLGQKVVEGVFLVESPSQGRKVTPNVFTRLLGAVGVLRFGGEGDAGPLGAQVAEAELGPVRQTRALVA